MAIATAMAVALSGCGSIFGKTFAKQDHVQALPRQASATPSLDLGRAHLAAGNNGLAVEAFQAALVCGEPQAASLNGLGVAFARIGRFDLAERYFQGAARRDPTDARYTENLARLQTSPAYAARQKAQLMAQAQRVIDRAPAPLVAPRTAQASVANPKIERVGRGQVFIKSGNTETAAPRTLVVASAESKRLRLAAQATPPVEPATATEPATAATTAEDPSGNRKVYDLAAPRKAKPLTAKP
jgi:tetratricopeptide (TPR) repeat protein